MKYLITTIAFIVLLNFSTKAQTKEETIKWITDKIIQCQLKNNVICRDNDGSNFRIGVENGHETVVLYVNLVYQFSTNNQQIESEASWDDITNANICSDCSNCNVIPINVYLKSGTLRGTRAGSSNHIALWMDWNAEPDLQNRMLKAFNHLAELNGGKQTF